MQKGKIFFTVIACFIVSIFSVLDLHAQDNQLTDTEKKAGWKLLFDGKTMDNWRTYQNKECDGWVINNGMLICKASGVTKRADLVTKEEFANFELSIDWNISKAHNSGIIYRATEEYEFPYESGPEYQIIDDEGYPEKLRDVQLTGANYDMNPPSKKVVKPAGEWNHTVIKVNGTKVEHWLNGEEVVEYEFWTPEWQNLKAQSKWKDIKGYGMATKGYIDLQDHQGGVAFKNIKIRVLK